VDELILHRREKTLDQDKLKTFISVSENKSFTKAAEEVFCTQPSVSMRIQYIEDYYGIKLFDRAGKKIILTDAGNMFLPYAKLLLNTYEEAEETINQIKNLSKGKLSILSSHTPGNYILPEVVFDFHSKYPGIVIDTAIQYSKNVINNILINKSDIGLVSLAKIFKDEKLEYEPILEDPLVLIVSPKHRWVNRGIIPTNEFIEETLLLANRSSSTVSYLENQIGRRLPPEKLMVLGNIEIIKRSVKSGFGISLISRLAVQTELSLGLLNEVKIQRVNYKRVVYSLKRKDKVLSPTAKVFLDILKKHIEPRAEIV
jgi:DNA-binding transcriptional LysR family regulator